MDFLPEIRSESKYLNICHCCLKEDGVLDISSGFFPEFKETCEDMLKNTFNIQLSQHLPLTKSLICEGCMTSVREASLFKQMVLQSQITLAEYSDKLQRVNGEDLRAAEEVTDTIKLEDPDSTDYTEDCWDDNEILVNLNPDRRSSTEITSLKRGKCKLERKSKSKRCKIKENQESVTNILPQKDWAKISARRGPGPLLRDSSLQLIQHSSLCVFQWNKGRYRCFCCDTPFTDVDQLKKHTVQEHSIENIEKKIIQQQNRLVKVEISHLQCKICQENVENITNLIEHLSKSHRIEITEHLLVPFRIEEELKCQICSEKFTMFRLLNIHVNKHYQKQVCHVCGAGFSNLVFLNLHKTRSHRPFVCKTCNLTFNTKTDKKNHDSTVHNVKFERKLRFPCTYCSERFLQEKLKIRHMVEKHNIPKPDYKCSICLKTFLTKSLSNNHVKNVHNKEKNKQCDICKVFFYTNSDVVRHRVSHAGEKRFPCVVCDGLFASRDSLRRHAKRSHGGVQ